jgi:hypothetical protein
MQSGIAPIASAGRPVVARSTSCRLAGEATSRSCLFVDPDDGPADAAGGAVLRPHRRQPRVALLAARGHRLRPGHRGDGGGQFQPPVDAGVVRRRGTVRRRRRQGACGAVQLPVSELLTPALASLQPHRVDLFARASSGALTHRYRPPGGSWTAAVGLGGVLRSQPTAVSWSPGRLDVFVRGTDHALWHKWHSGGRWSGWESFGRLSSAPAIASRGEGRLDVFVRGTDNQLWTRSFTSGQGWSGWRALRGVLTSSPTAASWGSDRVTVFVRGGAGAVYRRTSSALATWSSWTSLGGVAVSAPAAVSTGAGAIDLVVRGTDEALCLRRCAETTGWTGWSSLGGRFASGPGGTATGQVAWSGAARRTGRPTSRAGRAPQPRGARGDRSAREPAGR